jgi:hypothetical protein
MDRRMKESLDRWLTTPPEDMYMDDTEANDWGMAFINRIDEVVNELPEDEKEIKEHWVEGNAEYVLSEISVKEYLTPEQMDWINDFLSEI